LSLRVSVLDRVASESDALPESPGAGPVIEGVNLGSVRLAFSDGEHRVYVGLAGPGDSLFLWSENKFGGGGGIGPRETLATHGARIQGGSGDGGREVVGIVCDAVTAVHVGGIEAVLMNNVFVAVGAFPEDPIVLTTGDGSRTVQRPWLPGDDS
jgi:hypothetical protein